MKIAATLLAVVAAEWNNPASGQRLCETYKYTAVADFTAGTGPITGQITFTQSGCGKDSGVDMTGTLTWDTGVPGDVQHGWHIHQWGNPANGCGSEFTGGHFNPFSAPGGE